LPVRFSSDAGSQALDLARAIEYAVQMGACIVNLPVAGELAQPAVRRAMQYAAARNVLVVSALGATTVEPGDQALPNLLCVLPLAEDLAPLANYPGTVAHIAAPGYARVPQWRGDGHTAITAAAISAPYVSGCAALVKTLNPGWGYREIKEHLLSSGTPNAALTGHCQEGRVLSVANAVLGPIEPEDPWEPMTWSSLNDVLLGWKLRYRAPLCSHVAALYRPRGDQHWRELATARAGALRMTIPAEALRRSRGTLRLGCRDSNFHCDDVDLTIL
jgi:hypothetical protein